MNLPISVRKLLKGLFIDHMDRWKEPYYILLALPEHIKIRSIVEKEASRSAMVLDVGGRKSTYTRRLNGHLVILDKPTDSDGYLGLTSGLINKMSELPNTEVVLGDVLALPFSDKTYDTALCIEVIEHIDDDEKALFEIARVMRSNGRGLFTTPNGDVMLNINPYHVRHYSPKDFLGKLEKYFDEVKLWTICPWPKWYELLYRLLLKGSVGILLLYSVLRFAYLLLDFAVPRSLSGSGAVIVARVAKPKIHSATTKHS